MVLSLVITPAVHYYLADRVALEAGGWRLEAGGQQGPSLQASW